MITSADVRAALVKTLELDLVGPGPGHPLEGEQLWETEPPSRWYLTGFLVPTEAPEHLRFDPESSEVIDAPLPGEDGTGDDDAAPDQAPARKVFLPSSMGMSVLVPAAAKALDAEVLWGDYRKVVVEGSNPERKVWQRHQRSERVRIPIPKERLAKHEVPNSRGVKVYISARDVKNVGGVEGVPAGTRAVSVFVVNQRDPEAEERADEANLYQVELRLSLKERFVPRPNVRGLVGDDPDERIADLQYRDVYEFAVGHGVATRAVCGGPHCADVRTTWIPVAAVEKVDAAPVPGVELSMEALVVTASATELQSTLAGFGKAYGDWIATQRSNGLKGRRSEMAKDLLDRCDLARKRIEAGVAALSDPTVFEAFRIANRAMARAARQRNAQIQAKTPSDVDAPRWRPFQLAFLLMNLRGIADPPPRGPRDRRPALLPDRRRQDRGVPRPGGLHARPPAAARPRHRLGGGERADALHAPPADARPARPRRGA